MYFFFNTRVAYAVKQNNNLSNRFINDRFRVNKHKNIAQLNTSSFWAVGRKAKYRIIVSNLHSDYKMFSMVIIIYTLFIILYLVYCRYTLLSKYNIMWPLTLVMSLFMLNKTPVNLHEALNFTL